MRTNYFELPGERRGPKRAGQEETDAGVETPETVETEIVSGRPRSRSGSDEDPETSEFECSGHRVAPSYPEVQTELAPGRKFDSGGVQFVVRGRLGPVRSRQRRPRQRAARFCVER